MQATQLSDKDKAQLICLHSSGLSLRQACDEFYRQHPDKTKPNYATLGSLKKRFIQTGSLQRTYSKRANTVTTVEFESLVQSFLRSQPTVSISKLSQQLSASQTTVHRVIHRLGFRPYKFHHAVALKETDWMKRLEYCEWFKSTILQQPTLVEDIIFTDEAIFYLHGNSNSKNEVYWSQENPHVIKETHHSYNPKVLVWFGMHGFNVLGPYFFDVTLNSERYLFLLTEFLQQYLERLNPDQRQRTYFQQDGASVHYAKCVREWLDVTFPQRWIGRGGPINWPPRSPDLTPLDSFLWSRLKSVVYSPQPHSIDKLKYNIREASRNIPLEVASRVHQNMLKRVDKCIELEGRYFEHRL